MNIVDMKTAPTMANPHKIKAARVYDSEHAQAVHIALEPGEALKKHITPVDVFFVVLQGTGIIEIGDERREVGADALIESPARIPHCWCNESDALLRILVVKVPRPTEKTRLL